MDTRQALAGGPLATPAETRKRSFSGRILFVGIVVAVIAGIGWLVHARRTAATKKQAGAARAGAMAVPIVSGIAAQKDVPVYLDGLGIVQAYNTVAVHSRVDGQLQKIAFNEGQDVKTGDELALLDPAPFETALSQAEAKKAQDDATLANAKVQLARDEDLLKQQIVAQQDYDAQKTLTMQSEAQVKADQAAIDTARVQLNYTRILAPIDGRTGLRQVDAGNIVKESDVNPIVIITQLRPISVVFTLSEQISTLSEPTVRAVQKQMTAGQLKVIAVDRDNRTVIGEGKVTVLDNQVDTSTGTIRLKSVFPNEDLKLWPGQFVNARLLLTVRNGATVVPASVIQRGAEGTFAFVIKEDSTVEMRSVKVSLTEDGQSVVDEGLRPGDKVVVDGQYKLQNGSKVRTGPPDGGSSGSRAPTGMPGSDSKKTKKRAKPDESVFNDPRKYDEESLTIDRLGEVRFLTLSPA